MSERSSQMAQKSSADRDQPRERGQGDERRSDTAGSSATELTDWEIEHSSGTRKAHPADGEHFAGNATETLQAPITNEPVDQTRSHGNRPKGLQQGRADHR
jgi:hypothetical protein